MLGYHLTTRFSLSDGMSARARWLEPWTAAGLHFIQSVLLLLSVAVVSMPRIARQWTVAGFCSALARESLESTKYILS